MFFFHFICACHCACHVYDVAGMQSSEGKMLSSVVSCYSSTGQEKRQLPVYAAELPSPLVFRGSWGAKRWHVIGKSACCRSWPLKFSICSKSKSFTPNTNYWLEREALSSLSWHVNANKTIHFPLGKEDRSLSQHFPIHEESNCCSSLAAVLPWYASWAARRCELRKWHCQQHRLQEPNKQSSNHDSLWSKDQKKWKKKNKLAIFKNTKRSASARYRHPPSSVQSPNVLTSHDGGPPLRDSRAKRWTRWWD